MKRFSFDTTVGIGRREMLGRSALTVGALAVAGPVVLLEAGCKAQDLSGWVSSIVAGFGEIKPLLPQLGLSQAVIDRVSGFIDKAVSIARDFDVSYKAGKFANAAALFASLSGLVTQIAGELNVTNNRIVKLALLSIAVARIAVASLLQQQGAAAPPSLTAAARNPANEKAVKEIQRLASVDVEKLSKGLF